MAKRFARVCVCTLALFCWSARPASAGEWDFLWWLEQLSGPGPFKAIAGLNITQPVACYGVPVNFDQIFTESAGEHTFLFPDFRCGGVSRQRFWIKFALRVSRAKGDNNLQYAVPLNDDERKVTMWGFMGVMDAAVLRYLDIGAAAGVYRYSGEPFDSFSKLAFEPLRVTFKPMAVNPHSRSIWREFLELRYTVSSVPGGFDDRDFGAIANTFETNKEFQSTFAVVFNFSLPLTAALRR